VISVSASGAACGGSVPGDRAAGDGEPLGEAISSEGATDLESVDWDEATYTSVCGLRNVSVRGGVGEASSMGATYGVEVIDADLADLDGDGEDDAAVLVDCLGGDSYSPEVVVVQGTSLADSAVGAEAAPRLAVVAGGSLPGGARPLEVDAGDGGRVEVELATSGEPVQHALQFAPGVLEGGELPAPSGSVVAGVLVSATDGVAVVSVTSDSGYRLALPPDMSVLDPDLATAVPVDAVLGREVSVSVGEDETVAGILVAPAGP
jgi:hypothetical protein